MIDLEDALAPLVEHAPEPPDVAGVVQRGRTRRHRRAAALGTTLVVVVALAIGAIATIANRQSGTPPIVGPAVGFDHVRVTLLDGSQLEISGPASLGLTELPLSFNAQLDYPQAKVPWGHSFSVTREAPAEPGAVVGRYPTRDGHELVVHETPQGFDGVVRYDHWSLVVGWNDEPAGWANWAAALNARETSDGFLVIEPVNRSWQLGPTDAPEVQLGDAYAFYGPSTYPAGCSTIADARWRCDDPSEVRIGALDPSLADGLDEIDVDYTPAAQSVATITTLTGQQIEVTAPPSVLDRYVLQTFLTVDGLQTPEPISVQARRVPDHLRPDVGPKNYASADGQQLFVTHPPHPPTLQLLAGDWTIDVFVGDVPDADRARIASLFAVREAGDGFVVLDPRAPMHLVPGPAAEIVLDQVSIITSQGEPRVVPERADVHVERL
jgi:hypothetical protein